jgi:hypothetical protein
MKRLGIAMVLLLAAVSAASAEYPPAPRLLPQDCDRTCLYGIVDQYLDALQRKDATRLAWARNARYTENNVELPVGDGLWGTITGLGSYRLRLADATNGQVSVFGALDEADATSAYALRLKVVDRKISEAEMLVVRIKDFGALGAGPNPFANPRFDDKPILQQNLKPGEGRPRERMISLADGYFDTLQLNDGQLFTEFHPACGPPTIRTSRSAPPRHWAVPSSSGSGSIAMTIACARAAIRWWMKSVASCSRLASSIMPAGWAISSSPMAPRPLP